ncbi:MAG TPA: T9SS type A sorting domain-containing protein [Bacteroidota bacterium]|nr:T9SS type A sorting domain-containing protein [Bacteroidota bacterium]
MTGKSLTHVIGSLYRLTDTVVSTRGMLLDYQYRSLQRGREVGEHYFGFASAGSRPGESLLRQIRIPDAGALTVLDTQSCAECSRRQPEFENTRVLQRNLRVLWTLDIRPAIYQMRSGDSLVPVQGTRTVRDPDSIRTWGVYINGPAAGGWGTGGSGSWEIETSTDTARRMWDDGSHGDLVAGDSLYTRMILYSPDSVKVYSKGQAGQIFKFSIGGSDNECGRGGLGDTHLVNLSDRDSTYTVASAWGSINLGFYTAWDYGLYNPVNGVDRLPVPPPGARLEQNYPNPFNPSTTIRFVLVRRSYVRLVVFNVLGQRVATLLDAETDPGIHAVNFDARRLAGGVYFYRLSAGSYRETRRLLVIK